MKKLIKKIGLSTVLFCLMIILSTCQVSAKKINKTINLKQNKWVKLKKTKYKKVKKGYDKYFYFYKMSNPGEGYITLSFQKEKNSNECDIEVLRKRGGKYHFTGVGNLMFRFPIKGPVIIPVSKGNLYLRSWTDIKVKWKYTKIEQPSNYLPEKAISLKKGKKVKICQTPDYNFNRWFKIKLTKKQAITIVGDSVEVFDENFLSYDTHDVGEFDDYSTDPWSKYTQVTDDKLEPGTYYLCSTAPDRGYCYRALYWK